MNWKYVKIGLVAVLLLTLFIPTFLYVGAVDWSRQHTQRVAALPYFSDSTTEGAFRLKANDLEFRVRVAGMQNKGAGVILLHGFPESSLMWQPLLEEAASQGYRVLAFDQRGYSPNARPDKVADYHIDHLVEDVLSVADAVGFDTFHLVGHDWGAAVGWKTVLDFPERVRTWTAMSIPHIGLFWKSVLSHPEQKKRSAYIQKLQMPYLPEILFHLNQQKVVEGLHGKWKETEIADCLAIQREPGALTAALNWYRAVDFETIATDTTFKSIVQRPTLYIWGSDDPVITPDIIPQQAPLMSASYKELEIEAGHSLIQAAPELLGKEVLLHFSSSKY
ncbi:MAG: alpha/beta hydrolase [Bacteroidota bacterium]